MIIRGFDEEIHSQLGDQSKKKGVSINSIVKDAVDQWLKKQDEIPKRHHLLLYDNVESVIRMIKSLDKLAKEGEWFRCFVRSSNSSINEMLEKLDWFDGTLTPYKSGQKNPLKHLKDILQNISQNSQNKEICLLDFLINDISDSSVKEACYLEKEYDKNRLEGLVFCAYELNNLYKASKTERIEMFELHEQLFIINNIKI
jgi:23S rRNA A1618 N6-methylase RlmF